MRLALVICCAIVAITVSAQGQSSDDPDHYSVNTVRFALKLHSQSQQIIMSQTQRALARLGDGVSDALLKILTEDELTNPSMIKTFLPVVRDSFAQPENISAEVDKEPRVTLFLLKYLQLHVSDTQVLQDIQATIEVVKAKTAK
jgi:hypothetical protein